METIARVETAPASHVPSMPARFQRSAPDCRVFTPAVQTTGFVATGPSV